MVFFLRLLTPVFPLLSGQFFRQVFDYLKGANGLTALNESTVVFIS
jgi:hypothetical protein